ncbi:MAG: hypothetical protein IKP64_14570, partial [Selenomonadaceae bacterium]|nr:hypothetical protein [Selenomonadaceae bacterium]
AQKISITFRQAESLFFAEVDAVNLLPILIALAQLIDAAIRYLAFSKKVAKEVTRKLFFYSSLWCVASIFVYEIFFAKFSVDASTYKIVLFTGWLPYFIICAKLIPWGLPQHFFVFGMGVMCSLVQHTVGAFFVLKFVGRSEAELIFIEAATYLALFAIFLPVCGYFFLKLLPSREFFDIRPQGLYIAFLPLMICSAHLIRLADDVFVHSWAERLSRFYLPIVFFFFYRYILNAAKNFYELQRLERNKIRLESQLDALKEYDSLMTANRKKISVMRHDLRHSYNLVNALLETGEVDKALEHIRKQEKNLK